MFSYEVPILKVQHLGYTTTTASVVQPMYRFHGGSTQSATSTAFAHYGSIGRLLRFFLHPII